MIQTITSRDNSLIKHAKKLMNSPRYRREQRQFVVEGMRLCLDAVASQVTIQSLFYTEQAEKRYQSAVEQIGLIAAKRVKVSPSVMTYLTDTQTPQGVFCVCIALDKNECVYKMDNNPRRILALEDIQDPSNLGTILRTAEAMGIGGVLMSRGCCDIYSPKVLRGSMGAVFRIPFTITEDLPSSLDEMKKMGYWVYGAVPSRQAEPVTGMRFPERSAVVVGNEGNGLTDTCINACGGLVTIPMPGRAESLNAATAAGILLWEMVREDHTQRSGADGNE
ncbi:MAG: RNA methyltransferase [Clostridiales bacterium]|jgi:TrmH family RNA methyltransferase|nr:RNA methyltransferase [Clostridiales bacterium]